MIQTTILCIAALFATVEKPNVIVVFIDDMGWSDLSCYGGTRTETESIDQLAREGIKFQQFYVNSPICSPSRVALTTGQYPHRWKITSYLDNRKLNNQRGVAQWLDPSAPCVARQLQAAGYATGHFGKWHMGGQRDVGDAPLITEYGFKASLTNFEGLGPRVLPLKDAYDGKPPQKHALGSDNLGRGDIVWKDRSQVTTSYVDAAVQFIEEANTNGQPFYINVWPDDVHSPFFPPKDLRNETDGKKRQLYYAVLDAMDMQLARLFERVRSDSRLSRNTIIILMSDNGPEQGAGTAAPLRRSKTWLYEGGIRSPLIVWAPGLMKQENVGTTNTDSVLCALDVNRSIYALTGTVPATTLDGEDLSQTLLGFETDSRKQSICWRRPPDRPGDEKEDNPDLAIRDGNWKYMVNYDGSNEQLYDIVQDVSESTNLIDRNREIATRLRDELHQWNAQMPKDAGDADYADAEAQ